MAVNSRAAFMFMTHIFNRFNKWLPVVCLAAIFCFLPPGRGWTQDNAAPQNQEAGPSYAELSQYIENTLESEKIKIEQLKEEQNRFKSLSESIKTELSAYRIQLSTYGNLFVVPGIGIQDLEKANAANRSTLGNVELRLKEMNQKLETLKSWHLQTEEQQALNEKQLSQIKTETVKTAETKTLSKNLQLLTRQLSSKKTQLNDLIAAYSSETEELANIKTAFSTLAEKLEEEIKNRKKEELFKRREMPLLTTQWAEVTKELNELRNQIRQMETAPFWIHELGPILNSGLYLRSIFFVILFFLTVYFLFKLRRFCDGLMQLPFCSEYPWRSLLLQILHRSLPLLGITAFLSIYFQVRHLDTIPLFRTVSDVLWLLVFTKWLLDFLLLFNTRSIHQLPGPIASRLRLMLLTVRFFGIAYLVLDWQIAETALILLAIRLIFEIFLISWGLSFLKLLKSALEASFLQQKPHFKFLRAVMFGTIYTIGGGGPLLELAGYGTLALYWFVSWGRTAVVLLWGGLVYLLLDEWDQKFHETTESQPNTTGNGGAQPIQWLIFKLCWLLWFSALLLGVLFAWGARHAVIVNIIHVLKYPFAMGAMTLSLMGCVQAFLVLFFTQIVARLWRHVLKKKILSQSGIEIGLQESIITISLYVLWSFGILMALYAFGLSTASIAVAFGALGIGLGFGLQNIFNNFISGIILLFERPIQVGDDVEINGIWARVRKINVRSTVVQTYDNASLIIPNADFISSQVTNWSFKDKSLRRQISVGVAYGSNIELVRRTLLEIADKTPRVYKYPPPDVLFTDFGDSALIFKLRLWTHVDTMLKAETDIRFEIDRLFKERNITIAFPQCDVHLHHAHDAALLPDSARQNATDSADSPAKDE